VGGHEIVVLHGQPGSHSDWQQLADQLPPELRIVAFDRPGYGASRQAAGGFAYNARAVLAELDARGIERAVLAGHSYGGGVALAVAKLAPQRVEALVLLASVGPGCLTGWDRLLAAPVAGEACALAAWWLTPWLARARLAGIAWRRRLPIAADEHVNWQIWGNAHHENGPLWRITCGHSAASTAARRPQRHPHPGQDYPSASGGPARCPRAAAEPGRPPPSPPRCARGRRRDHRVPGCPGQPADACLISGRPGRPAGQRAPRGTSVAKTTTLLR
jgi:pimeloyl-ACP methyl ester carboxylesterase